MKLIRKDFTKDQGGFVKGESLVIAPTMKSCSVPPEGTKLIPEEAEDLWQVYNLIAPKDLISAVTVRKVNRETSTGGNEAERVRLKLQVQVETVEYDNVAAVLRIRGKNMEENEHVRLGAYHTLEIDLQRPFTLTKNNWDAVAMDLLKQSCDPGANADVAAVILQEGLANICLIGQSVTTAKARIEASIPRKRGAAAAGYDKALNKFFENVLQGVIRHVDFSVVKCLIIASPGFTKDQFHDFMMLEAARRDLRAIIENKKKIVLAHSSSGYKHSLKEVLAETAVLTQIKETRAAKEVKAMEKFFSMLSNVLPILQDPARAFYGPKHVEAANDRIAIQTLLITDELFRSADIPTRRKYVDLVESVRSMGGDVHIFSAMHPSGEQLGQLTGIAAILRFPLPDLEDMEL